MCVPAQGAGEGLGLEPELSPGAGEGQVQHSKHHHPHAHTFLNDNRLCVVVLQINALSLSFLKNGIVQNKAGLNLSSP